ncbi:MAG: ATPase domain-containing protein [Candidatus Bathyarchaeota archaeon]|jgi:KaiC/GvpD/RAD55 family RecA-like ATPase
MVRKVETGIAGLDEMLRGGFPEGRMILVIGGPGTGKTIFCSQFLHHGVTKQEEKTVYISLDETKSHFLEEMSTFGWNFKDLEEGKRFTFIDASNIRRIPEEAKVGKYKVEGKELARERLIDSIFTTFDGTKARAIDRFIGDLGAQRVVLDSISGLTFRFAESWKKRQAILDIMEALDSTGATCLITSEAISIGEERQVQPEEYLAQGAILLQTRVTGERAVRIVKMRGTEVDSAPRPYQIGQTGIEVYPDQTIYQT